MRPDHSYHIPTPKSPAPCYSAAGQLIIELIHATTTRLTTEVPSFDGICMDTGAQISVAGKAQAQAYCKSRGIPFVLTPSTQRFRFGDVVT